LIPRLFFLNIYQSAATGLSTTPVFTPPLTLKSTQTPRRLDTCGQSQSTADQSQILKSIFISNL
jgi:hypothetical protein